MVMKVSSPMPADLSPPEYASDPDEKEISDDEDDDRNHKHRRREARSESSEKDSTEHTIARSFRKHNRPFQNGYSFRDNESQANEPWKNFDSSGRDFNKFEKRQLGSTSFSQATRTNQSFSGNLGPGRGRGRDPGAWNHRDPWLNSVDIASQMIQRGSIPPGLFPGMGLPGVPGVQNGSWGTFGLLPGAAGCMEALPPVGLQGTFAPQIASSVNIGIPRQRCRDFEERGFCLRGDMCPMEHGVNRIVVEDVQSLSQFNLPVSLPSAPILGTPPVSGALTSIRSSAMLINNKGPHGKTGKSIVPDVAVNSSYSTSGNLGASDLYDPDQLLWSNGGPEALPLLSLRSQHADDPALLDHDNAGRQARKAADMGHQDGGVKLPVASQGASLSVWGRIKRGKNDNKGEFGSIVSTSGFSGNENGTASAGGTKSSYRGKQIIANASEQNAGSASNQAQFDASNTPRKPTQKALRTLFVNGIPLKNNKREVLFAHFKKFGEVIDIHIPSNSERAFVQFSKREEAESALMSPDAVMGNRFIKLWWANRDSIVDEATGNLPSNPKHLTPSSVPGNLSSAGSGKDIYSAPSKKAGEAVESGTHLQDSDPSKPIMPSVSNVTPPNQKKLESLEQLKEELRKKQEMLDRKRDEFKRQLVKLERQATVKGDVISEQSNKRQKVGLVGAGADVSTPRSSDAAAAISIKLFSTSDEEVSSQNKVANGISNSASVDPPSANTSLLVEESSPLKEQTWSSSDVIPVSLDDEQESDSRPTSFKVLPPLPTGFANVATLEEHFLAYGELTLVKLEHMDGQSDGDTAGTAETLYARICFRTHASAERAFYDGKFWHGHNMSFLWSTDSGDAVPRPNEESSSSTVVEEDSNATIQSSGKGDIMQAEGEETGNGVVNDSASRRIWGAKINDHVITSEQEESRE